MVENNQDKFNRACATLSSLRKNIGDMTSNSVSETCVREFHTALDKLESIGIDVSEFRIPDAVVKPEVTASWWDGESHQSYSEEKYVERSFILTKLDAILGYLKIITSEKPRRMGYPIPDNQENDG